jgi:hypothetical protein
MISRDQGWYPYLIEVTSQFRATAALQILLPKKPFPPHTTIFLLADAVAADEAIVAAVVYLFADEQAVQLAKWLVS